ncbi:MAG TPA: PaaI family thioesterase [Kofleriaceae bacterium]|nr:PaaI family thioesterase [Kofleriaceae bacterium]
MPGSGDHDREQLRLELVRRFTANVPHNLALGLRVEEIGPKMALYRLPYALDLVGNPDSGTLHGGAITALLDATSGAAVFAALADLVPIATLDLRIDYLRPAEPGRDVLARGHCYKITKNVAFTRAVAYHDDEADPIAHSVGTFMLSTKGKR